jgi:PAP_fibrillin
MRARNCTFESKSMRGNPPRLMFLCCWIFRFLVPTTSTAAVMAYLVDTSRRRYSVATWRNRPFRPQVTLNAVAAVTVCKEDLLNLLQDTPSGRATPSRLTEQILGMIRQLEGKCPTSDDKVLSSLSGSWELLWTAQDPERPETKRAFTSWINPLENQSYSNNPEGRSNPFLPIQIQNRLEKIGLISTIPARRSTQAIDLKSGLIRNIVAINLGAGRGSSAQQRRASLTVTVKFTPAEADPRRVNVKFESCRISIPGTPIEWNFPLGIIGPTGWLRTVYIDDDLRVTRGHKGSVFVLCRPRRAVV